MLVQACRLEISLKGGKGVKIMVDFVMDLMIPSAIMYGWPIAVCAIVYVIDAIARYNGHAPVAFLGALIFGEPVETRVRVKAYRGPRRVYVDKTKVYRRRF